MSRGHSVHSPCPLCGRITRIHSRMVLADVESIGRSAPTQHETVICRDCAFAMVLRSQVATMRV